ncbi:MAG: hypothetical protein ACHQVS_01355 [Candidatus Babeliales bacterium]
MRKIFYIVCMMSIIKTGNAFQLQSERGSNKVTAFNQDRLDSRSFSPLHNVQEEVVPWSTEWAAVEVETEAPSSGICTRANACYCFIAGTCISFFIWAMVTGKVRA